ncbi:hypothetical protein LCGC14_0924090 [marine sediment metagenome]|uniref:DUF2997 domain-containing protein n=1 Tax=marine sediment metagenome TaxID=412755 RepID=A0A0F9NUQ3_9ZZZZ|nr:DUF2997 domain-containing protein [bacterium]
MNILKEEKIIIDIYEDGKITAEADGFIGKICMKELEKILEDMPEIEETKHKKDYYKKDTKVRRISQVKR